MIEGFDFRLGAWQDVLADVEIVDSLIADPPYGERTHDGHNELQAERGGERRRERCPTASGFQNALDYDHWTSEDVGAYVEHWSPRVRGWFVGMTSHDLIHAWEAAFESAGRYAFAPIPYVDFGKGPRVLGDGAASWTVYVMTARPRSKAWLEDWRARRKALGLSCSLDGAYLRAKGDVIWTPPSRPGEERGKRIGGKPLGVMKAIVGDYSFPDDLVLDTHAGHVTTGRAALELGRRFVGCERVPEVHAAGLERLRAPIVMGLPGLTAPVTFEQSALPGFD